MNIYITESAETHPDAIELLKQAGHRVITDNPTESEIDALFIRTYTNVTAQYLDRFPKVRYILRIGVGTDTIDMDACKKRQITVINAPGSNANAVAEFIMGLMISGLRNIPAAMERIRTGQWRAAEIMGEEIKGKTIGIVGCGAIGKLLAKKMSSFEVKQTVGYDPYLDEATLKAHGITKSSLDDVLKQADIITLHLPLTDETKNLINASKLALMKPTAFLINTARGGIVNELDLIAAIKNHTLRGAALDVFETEPTVREELRSMPAIICTPHIAGYTKEADREMALMPVRLFLKAIQKQLVL